MKHLNPEQSPYLQYLSVHLASGYQHQQPLVVELEYAQRIIQQSNAQFLAVVAAIIGSDSLTARLVDLAANNSVECGKIPIVYDHVNRHPHNIMLGIPYTGNMLYRMSDLFTVAPHELAHTVLGKFNDGLAEPIANLFIPNRFYDPENDRPKLGDRLATRAALELFREGKTVCTFSSLRDIFGHRPFFRNVVQQYYSDQIKQLVARKVDSPKEAANLATHRFVRLLVQDRYHRDFVNHQELNVHAPSDVEVQEIDSFFDANGHLHQLRKQNPNEGKGYARTFNMQLGRTLMLFLLDQFEPSKTKQIAPERAREHLFRFLTFYYQPFVSSSLEAFGFADFEALAEELLKSVTAQTAEFLKGKEDKWEEFKVAIQNDPCYDPERWHEEGKCERRDNSPLVQIFFERRPGPPAEPPPRIYHPLVAAACQDPVSESSFSLQDHLGHGLDYGTYVSLADEHITTK